MDCLNLSGWNYLDTMLGIPINPSLLPPPPTLSLALFLYLSLFLFRVSSSVSSVFPLYSRACLTETSLDRTQCDISFGIRGRVVRSISSVVFFLFLFFFLLLCRPRCRPRRRLCYEGHICIFQSKIPPSRLYTDSSSCTTAHNPLESPVFLPLSIKQPDWSRDPPIIPTNVIYHSNWSLRLLTCPPSFHSPKKKIKKKKSFPNFLIFPRPFICSLRYVFIIPPSSLLVPSFLLYTFS